MYLPLPLVTSRTRYEHAVEHVGVGAVTHVVTKARNLHTQHILIVDVQLRLSFLQSPHKFAREVADPVYNTDSLLEMVLSSYILLS